MGFGSHVVDAEVEGALDRWSPGDSWGNEALLQNKASFVLTVLQ